MRRTRDDSTLAFFVQQRGGLAASKECPMTVDIEVDGRRIPFRLDWAHSRWHAMEPPDEGSFPLIAIVDGRRYELYSDGTVAEVEREK
jgi:hypothetical protein